MIAYLRRRRAQANRCPMEPAELALWKTQTLLARERAAKSRRANRRWLQPGRES